MRLHKNTERWTKLIEIVERKFTSIYSMADNQPNSDVPKGMRLVVRAWGAFSALCKYENDKSRRDFVRKFKFDTKHTNFQSKILL